MRIPVFARGTNPRIDRPILRKSLFYGFEQVQNFLADWVDPDDHTKGILCREFVPRERPPIEPPQETSTCSSDKALGVKFIRPSMETNPTLPRPAVESLTKSAPKWDWSCEVSA